MNDSTDKTAASDLDSHRFWCEEKLRNVDTDRQGHVNNTVIAAFFEAGRIEVLHHPDNTEPWKTCGIVLARQLINYKKELHFPGKVRVGTRVSRIGRSSFDFEQVLMAANGEVASGEATCVLIDLDTRKPVEVPAAMRQHLTGSSS